MRVLVACEFSGIVREAFTRAGHYATSCDLVESDIPGSHYVGDVRDILDAGWDLMIAHPPCTYLANSGVSWLYKDESRWDKMREGAEFFKTLLDRKDIPYIAIENPIMHKHAVEIIGRRQDQVLQPWMFGHPEKKATCLWLKGLPPLVPTLNVKEEMLALPKSQQQRLHWLGPSEDRAKIRSTTFTGIADAMARQWTFSRIWSYNK